MLQVTLYSRPGCHLCDAVQLELEGLTAVFPHTLQVIDITRDRELHQKYAFTIPVVCVGEFELAAPIDRVMLLDLFARIDGSN